jgi:hypothetical protein
LQWKHNATPLDVELVLVRKRNPTVWVSYVVTLLFGALNRHDPKLFAPLRSRES